MSWPRISIVTPSLNQGRFIEHCIHSVAAQHYPDVEHIVIDAGSTDDTHAVIERQRHCLAQVVVEPDDGAADAINKGLRLCTGDVVAWLNADDYLLPGALEQVAAAWRRDPHASFWFGNGMRVDEDGNWKQPFNAQPIMFDRRALVEGVDYILQPATFMNRKAVAAVGGLDTTLRWAFDWDLWIRLAAVAPPRPIQAVLAATREWGDTLTATGGFRRAEELRRLAERHSGHAITYGALCYYLDTLLREVNGPATGLTPELAEPVARLLEATATAMTAIGTDSYGMPTVAARLAAGLPAHPEALCVAIDLFPLVPGASGGIVPWVAGVLRRYAALFPDDRLIVFHAEGPAPISLSGEQVVEVALPADGAAYYAALLPHLKTGRVDVLLRSFPQEPWPEADAEVPAFPLERQVFVIPDLQHDYFPEFFSRRVLSARRRAFHVALTRAGGIATLTEHSRDTLLASPWHRGADVFLMPAALPEELAAEEAAAEPSREQALGPAAGLSRYFFMPANLWPHKNHRRLFEALRLALPGLPEGTGLVLTGSPGGWAETVTGFEDLPIHHLGYVDHGRMRALFRHAEALVYFSLFEGFGMPLLEAFHHGTPVLCSNVTSLPEVGGDAVLVCDPLDVAAMAGLMRRIVAEPDLRAALVARGRARLAAYDWDASARALRQGFLRVIAAAKAPRPKPERPLVSIVMPTRNQGRFIRAAIDSVLGQTYGAIELIVVDGASTDDTVAILHGYGDRIAWISEPDRGQTDAINKGMARARGEVLAYLNSDDILLPDAVERVVAHFRDHPEWDMIYGNADYIDGNGKVIGRYNTAPYSFERLMDDCCVCQPAAFWRRRVARIVGPFNDALQTAMDYEYWLRIANAGGIIRFVPDTLAQSRLHEDAKTLTMREKIYAEVFQVCLAQGGYISFGYVAGLWHHRICEKHWWGRHLGRLAPVLYKGAAVLSYARLLARLHGHNEGRSFLARHVYFYLHRRSPFLAEAARRIGRRIVPKRAVPAPGD